MKKDNHKKLLKVDVKKFTVRGVDFEITKKGEHKGLLMLEVLASKNGVDLPVNNPLFFKNPPLKMGHDKEEDHKEVLKEIVAQCIETTVLSK